LENNLKSKHIKFLPSDNYFNCLIDIYLKWYQNYLKQNLQG